MDTAVEKVVRFDTVNFSKKKTKKYGYIYDEV